MYSTKSIHSSRIGKRLIILAGTVLFALWWLSFPAKADGGLDIRTPYPGITAKAGEALSFDLSFDNSSASGDAVLSTEGLPEGWEAYFSGGGSRISKINIPSGMDSATAVLHISVPADTAEGTYRASVKAVSDHGLSDTMVIEMKISELEAGQSNFTSEYPEQEGASGTSFSFTATLVNNNPSNQSYSLSAKAPEGWQVAFKPSGQSTQVASIDVDSAGSQGISISVTPPNNVESGTYQIPCSAISANETLNMDLSVTITGSYKLELSTPDGRLSFDAHAKEKSDVTLSVTNQGNVDLQNINLTSSVPTGWSVDFDNSTIDVLEAGATKEVTAHVTPSSDAMTGDYVVSIKADCSEVGDSAEFRVSVKTKTVWGFAAVAVIIVLIGGIGYVFRKYGRR